MTRSQLKKYRQLAARYGLRVYNKRGRALPPYNWRADGVIRIWRSSAEMLAHELAHYLVATRDERREPEYGLGTSVFALGPTVLVRTTRAVDEVEADASLVGIYLQRHIQNHAEANETFLSHRWDWQAALECVRDLIRRGVLLRRKRHTIPCALVRAPRKADIFRKA